LRRASRGCSRLRPGPRPESRFELRGPVLELIKDGVLLTKLIAKHQLPQSLHGTKRFDCVGICRPQFE
jgi:hypothetical protein